jgi:signal transduction histidine kinase
VSIVPFPAKLYAVLLTASSLGLALALLSGENEPGAAKVIEGIAAACLIAVAWLRPFPLSFKRKLYLDTSILVTTILLFQPGVAMAIAGSGTLLAHVIRRQDWTEALFNSAQMMLQAAAGSAVLVAGGYNRTLDDLDRPINLVLILIAGAVMFLVNNLAVATMIALQSGMAIGTVGRRVFANFDQPELIGYLAQLGLGVAGAVLVLEAPWMIPLLAFPVAVVYLAVERNGTLRWQAELRLNERDLDLAEAQRIAQLGSWKWDLVSGVQVWSDETFRLLGMEIGEPSPAYEAFLSAVHPADRSDLDAAVHDAMYSGRPFDIEHRIQRADGAERIVHQRGEVVFDEDGAKTAIVGTIHDVTERRALEEQVARFAERDRIEAERAEGRRRLAASRELERVRLARELHDGPVQNLLAISYTLAANHRAPPNKRSRTNGDSPLEEIRNDILGVVAELRNTIGELRPPGLSEFGLAAALEGYVAELNRRDGEEMPEIIVDLDGVAEELPDSVAITVFRIAQEGLRNALRHAQAREVRISLSREDDYLRLQICDDGQGFRFPARINDLAERGHFGLIGLVERVDQANGEIEIDSANGRGTTINVSMPIATEEERRD